MKEWTERQRERDGERQRERERESERSRSLKIWGKRGFGVSLKREVRE